MDLGYRMPVFGDEKDIELIGGNPIVALPELLVVQPAAVDISDRESSH